MQARPRYRKEPLIVILFFLAVCSGVPGRALCINSSRLINPLQTDRNNSQEIARLKAALASSDEEERRNAVLTLATIATPAAASVLATALDDSSPLVRAAAIAGLGYTGDSTYAPSAAALLARDKDVFVRKAAAYALGRLGGPVATAGLIEALKDKKEEVRGAAAAALGEYANPSAIEPLISSLGDKSDFVRAYAARALGINRSAARAATPLLIKLLDADKSLEVKQEAAVALGLIGDRAALPALSRAERDENPYLSRAALEAIKQIEQTKPGEGKR
ncbi:MAG: HEAT repeat domain-containing protein [Blastocatellia bacterium]|nr:HEAT repeat domain-containing protein [Blastocatellia bacterium]